MYNEKNISNNHPTMFELFQYTSKHNLIQIQGVTVDKWIFNIRTGGKWVVRGY